MKKIIFTVIFILAFSFISEAKNKKSMNKAEIITDCARYASLMLDVYEEVNGCIDSDTYNGAYEYFKESCER